MKRKTLNIGLIVVFLIVVGCQIEKCPDQLNGKWAVTKMIINDSLYNERWVNAPRPMFINLRHNSLAFEITSNGTIYCDLECSFNNDSILVKLSKSTFQELEGIYHVNLSSESGIIQGYRKVNLQLRSRENIIIEGQKWLPR